MAIIAEGKNATERHYFSSFNSQKAKYIVHMVSGGGKTDPENLQKEIEKFWDKNGLSAEEGDLAFVVLDLDCDNKKAEVIRQQPNTNSEFIVSNPCFEVWFLEHFNYSAHAFNSSDEVIKEDEIITPSEGQLILFASETCPNCKIAKSILDKANIEYKVLIASQNIDLVEKYGIKQAPTLVIENAEGFEKFKGVSDIKGFIKSTAATIA